jgi:hypothetical protein
VKPATVYKVSLFEIALFTSLAYAGIISYFMALVFAILSAVFAYRYELKAER